MCGIFGMTATQNVTKNVLAGIKKLEYRGYDSAGIAFFTNNKIKTQSIVFIVTELCRKKTSFAGCFFG